MTTQSPGRIYVWDPFVRIFHWCLVITFTVAFLVGDDALTVHVWAGYAVGALVIARVLWGFVGSRYARFFEFVYKPATVVAYVSDLLRLRGKRYLGHSPGGGAMVVVLLILLAATVLTGLIVYGGEHQGGPMPGIVSRDTAESLEDVHNVLANVTLAFILGHIAAVVLASYAHRENLVWAMFTGWKRS